MLIMFCIQVPAVTSFASSLVLVLSIGGTPPSGTMIGGIDATVNLPAGVSVQADPATGMVTSPVLMPSGQWEVGSIALAEYEPAAGAIPGTVRVGLINAAGFAAGEFARLTCEVVEGSSPNASSFPIGGLVVTDLSGVSMPEITAGVALAGVSPRSLSVTVSGTGGGAVTSVPSAIACPGADCTAAFGPGSTVTLTAFPDTTSTFGTWTGACSGSTTICTMVMDGDKAVAATFNAAPPVMGGEVPYLRLQDAFSLMTGGGTVRALGIEFTENPNLNWNVSFVLRGGYDGGYTTNTGWTMVRGTITIGRGSLTVDKVQIR